MKPSSGAQQEGESEGPESVSSLLSRFESMKPATPTPSSSKPAPKPKPKPQAFQMPRASIDIERPTSLDIPRNELPQSASPLPGTTSRAPPPPLPKPRRAPREPHEPQTPVAASMPRNAVPAVDITSPKSPAKTPEHPTCRAPASLSRSPSLSPRPSLPLPRNHLRSQSTSPINTTQSRDSTHIGRSLTPPSQSPAPPINRSTKPPPSPTLLARIDTSPGPVDRPGSVPLRNASPASANSHGGSNRQNLIPSREVRVPSTSLSDAPEARPVLPPRRVSPTSQSLPKQSALSQGFGSTVPKPTTPTSMVRPRGTSQSAQGTSGLVGGKTRPSVETQRPSMAKMPSQVSIAFDGSGASPAASPTTGRTTVIKEFPEPSRSNRRAPYCSSGLRNISIGYEARLFDVCGDYVCTGGILTRVWSLTTGKLLMSMAHGEHVKATSIKFRPSRNIEEEGQYIWVGTNWGELQEIDLHAKRVTATNNTYHSRREVSKILCCGAEVWTIDDEGKLFVWPVNDSGAASLASAVQNARVARRHGPAAVVGRDLWLANGNEVRVYQPTNDASKPAILHTQQALSQPGTGEILCSAVLSGSPDQVVFGHSDGKVSVYSVRDYSCLYIHSVSMFRIPCMLGVGGTLWTGNVHGKMYVYDTQSTPWVLRKEWDAHPTSPLHKLAIDGNAVWKTGDVQVISLAVDNTLGLWDGQLRADWMSNWMEQNTADYCDFDELSALVLTWNVGACTPGHLRYNEKDSSSFQDLIIRNNSPDIVVFGLQELVDLDDKKLTAKSFFKGKLKDEYGQEQLRSVYRTWRDYFSGCLYDSTVGDNSYTLIHSASLVGLFTCVFVRSPLKRRLRDLQATEVKTGMGGLHGNKGALVVRFVVDDTSVCLVNCHLAAGQTQTVNRNHDVEVILDNHILPSIRMSPGKNEVITSGGDGSMIMDHEICILNGDLNYRIDTLSRERVIKEAKQNNFRALLERDQLLLSRQKIPSFRLRAFQEGAITFAPTYKYDVGTDNYDTSEKRRTPAWCDRILWKGGDCVKQRTYERLEVRVSDHRPVCSRLKLRIKSIETERRSQVWKTGEREYTRAAHKLSENARRRYLMQMFDMTEQEAEAQLQP